MGLRIGLEGGRMSFLAAHEFAPSLDLPYHFLSEGFGKIGRGTGFSDPAGKKTRCVYDTRLRLILLYLRGECGIMTDERLSLRVHDCLDTVMIMFWILE